MCALTVMAKTKSKGKDVSLAGTATRVIKIRRRSRYEKPIHVSDVINDCERKMYGFLIALVACNICVRIEITHNNINIVMYVHFKFELALG